MDKVRNNDSFKTSTDIYTGHDTNYSDMYQKKSSDAEEYISDEENAALTKKKKRRKKHYMLRIVLFVGALVGLYLFLTSSVFSISEISIKDNRLITDDTIIKEIGIKPGDNMFKWTEFSVRRALKSNPYIKSINVKRKLPDKYIVVVEEIIPTAAIAEDNIYLIMDSDGTVMDTADGTMTATLITGLKVKKYKKGELPEFKDDARFKEIMNLINKAGSSKLYFKKIKADGKSGDSIKAYVSDTMMCSGRTEDIINALEGLKAILYDLHENGVERGRIKIDNSGYAAFSPVTD